MQVNAILIGGGEDLTPAEFTAADFNGDGRVDLYVLNIQYTDPYTTEDTGFKFYRG